MKISILTPDLSHNCLGRSYILAKILQRHFNVEIAGPIFGNKIWEPVAGDKSIQYKSVVIRNWASAGLQLRKLAKKIDGDVIYATKPLLTSFGMGLLKKFKNRKPLVLDIDDWQMGIMKDIYGGTPFTKHVTALVSSALYPYHVGSYWNNLFGEKMVYLADDITISNHFLQKKFGGTIIWHGRDTSAFKPDKFDKNILRKKYGINKNMKVVMFFGSPRPYKGIEFLIEAMTLIPEKNTVLVIVGLGKSKYTKDLAQFGLKKLGIRFITFGLQPFNKVPEFLSISDIVVIPQMKRAATVGQVPAKIFDAMAMAKPIISSDVGDLPYILKNCGWIIEPGNSEELASTIRYVLNNSKEAEEKGFQARIKCMEKFSWDAQEKALTDIFKKYE